MYFGQSFGRIGADFRLSLVPIFTSCIREVTLSQLKGAEEKFKTGIYHLAFKAAISKSRDETVRLFVTMVLVIENYINISCVI